MSEGTSRELLFVYGRLRRGGADAFRMDGAEFILEGTVSGTLHRVAGTAGLILGNLTNPRLRVKGEIYRVSRDLLQQLEEFEGVGPDGIEEGDRRRTRVLAHSPCHPGEAWEAWTWEWTGTRNPEQRIRSGDWLQEEIPRFSDRLKLFPWFTWISMICLVSLPIWALLAPITGYYKSQLAVYAGRAMILGAMLSPFASVLALWLAKRRGENDSAYGCLYTLSLLACGLMAISMLAWLIDSLRG